MAIAIIALIVTGPFIAAGIPIVYFELRERAFNRANGRTYN